MERNKPSKNGIKLKAPKGHTVPALLEEFAMWLETQEYHDIGRTEIDVREPCWMGDGTDERLRRDGFVFMATGDDDQIMLLNRGKKAPPAVCLLGNEGATETLAGSLEEFLHLLAGEGTGPIEFAPKAANALKKWLKGKGLKVPKSPPFDLDAYLDGGSGAPTEVLPAQPSRAGTLPQAIENLAPTLREVALLVGRRADDLELVAFFARKLGKKVPDSVTPVNAKYVVDKAHGLEFHFDHEIVHDQYPPVPKSKSSFVPYLDVAWIKPKVGEELPFGLKFGMKKDELRRLLGAPAEEDGDFARWVVMLDGQRDLVLKVEVGSYWLQILEARKLSLGGAGSKRAATGLFVAWAALRDLLNLSKFTAHTSLLEAVRNRQRKGSELLDAAMPRGLWDVHLADLEGLREYAKDYTGNAADEDLKAALGLPLINFEGIESIESLNQLVSGHHIHVKAGKTEVTAPGHFESRVSGKGKLSTILSLWTGSKSVEIDLKDIREMRHDVVHVEDDDWSTVTKLVPVFDKRFAKWIKPARK